MSSYVYQECLEALARGDIDFTKDKFKAMLVGEDQLEVSGLGYSAGGVPVLVTVVGAAIKLGGFSLDQSTLTARAAIYYRDRGGHLVGMPEMDTLIAYVDFKKNVSSMDGAFTLTESWIKLGT